MRTINPLPQPELNFSEAELAIYNSYVSTYLDENEDLTASDRLQLMDAAIFHIMHLRFINADRQTWNTRFLPKSIELSILDSLGLSRRQRVDTRKVSVGTLKDNRGNEWEEADIKELAFTNKVRRT